MQKLLRKVKGYSALVVGDAIRDEYQYVKPQWKSPKENVISNMLMRRESFRGGVWAVADHARGFCERVDVMSGDLATVKSRYVEDTYKHKLFEVHSAEICDTAPVNPISTYDLVLVADFGHGLITDELRLELEAEAEYLAVNCQTNSANHGFNLVSKYDRADYVVCDELEARLATQDRESSIERVIEKLGFEKIVVTLGPLGAIGYDAMGFVRLPSRAGQVVDTMGAGDAFFAVTAPLAKAGADMKTLLGFGNAAAAAKVEALGQRPVTRASLLAHL